MSITSNRPTSRRGTTCRARRHGQRIKVLMALEGVLGGTLRHLDYLLRFADPAEFDIHLALSARRAPHVREDFQRWESAGWHVHEIPMRREISPQHDLHSLGQILSLCRRERFDVVHTHCAKAGFLGRLAARMTGARTVHTPHVFPFSHPLGEARRDVYEMLERMASRWTDSFVLLSNYQLNLLLSLGIDVAGKPVVVPNGIVPEEFRGADRTKARRELGIAPKERLVLFAGRFREQKGLDILLEAAQILSGEVPEMRIVLLGEGPLRGWLESDISSRALSDVVSLTGLTRQMAPWYAACDLVVMPSRAEGMPYVLLEAKAAGRPIVASLVCGMEEFIENGEDGFLVPPENPEALAHTLKRVLSDPALLARAKKMARRSFKDCWKAERSAARTYQLWRELA